MITVEVLRAARALIDTPEKWWKPGTGPGVCALVALREVSDFPEICVGSGAALARVMDVEGAWLIPSFNNSRTHAEVLTAFDEAIRNEEAKQQEFTVESSPVFA